jgi:transposase
MSKKIVGPAYVAAMARAEADPASARFWVGLGIVDKA